MRKNFSVSLSEKASMRLDEKKVEIGQKYFGQTKKLDEVLDDSDKRTKYGINAAGSYIKASLTGDKETKRKRLRGNKFYKKKVDAAGKKLIKSLKKD
jgi:hypothetical protein